jgi:hypothetical protein
MGTSPSTPHRRALLTQMRGTCQSCQRAVNHCRLYTVARPRTAGRRCAVRMQGCLQCRPLQVARAGVSRPCTWRTPTPSPASQQGAAAKGSVRSGRTAVSARRAVPASHKLSMDAPSAASETGLGHVFVSLFPGARLCSAASNRACAPDCRAHGSSNASAAATQGRCGTPRPC